MEIEKIGPVFENLKNKGIKCRYDFLIELYALLKLNGAKILLSELNALSGYSLRFVYSTDGFHLHNKSISYIAENLKTFLGLELVSVSNNEFGNPPFIVYPENLLIFDIKEDKASFYRNVFYEEDNIRSVLKNGAVVFKVKQMLPFDRKLLYNKEKFANFADLMEKEFFKEYAEVGEETVPSGKNAYERFINDLRDQSVSFVNENAPEEVPFFSLYPQWTAINGTLAYLLGVHHFLNKKAQKEMQNAVRHFEDALLFWREWERAIGSPLSPMSVVPMKNRRRAANAVEKAKSAYMLGVLSVSQVKKLM